ncbi:MAG: 1-acyl-sn-glycerol-3-phosphate acyltransferase [Treponema sp.]|jgi:glycerol-3-phosphate O-acyltransferase|nr:1-acyl-sn-glycerol-3-phosphate acyltransferase [Treponema sp.]
MADTLKGKYGKHFAEMAQVSHAAEKIDETKIYEEANLATRKYMNIILDDNFLPDSGLINPENFKAFYESVVKEGKTGLILMEHYSNLDLPGIIYLLEKHGEDWSKDFASRIVAVAGMKLNEAHPLVRAWTEGFSRVVIYPTRSLNAVNQKEEITEEEKIEEEKRARKINFAAMRKVDELKKQGKIILVFPSGTRYRPGCPDTKRGLREIDSYLRLFENVLLVGVNGNSLRIDMENPDDMLADIVVQDTITLTASPIINCKEFRNKVLATLPEDTPDPKQVIVDTIMAELDKVHEEGASKR